MGDQGLQSDLHLKPLDNAALFKPLRKAADGPAASPAAARQESEPVAPPKQAMASVFPDDDDDDNLFSLPKTAQIKPVDDLFSGPENSFDDADDTYIPAPSVTPAPAPKPVMEPPQAPIETIPEPLPQIPDEPDEDEDEEPDSDAEPPKPAQKPPTSYRPTDEQVHMMELMKSIFASALNAGISGGQPPQIPSPEPKRSMGDLRKDLMALQQKIRDAQIPVVIVLEGLSASGKGTMLGMLIEGLDSRGYQTHPIRTPNCVEEAYPPMWRYWTNMPKKGNIALFCSSWYGELNKTCLAHEDDIPEILPQRLNEIISMESQLICDGTLILKFFLHISQQEQYDRLKKMESKKSTAWHVVDKDHEQNKRYDEYMKEMDNLMSITNLKGAPWHILDATDLKACRREIYETVIRAFQNALREQESNLRPWDVPMLPNLSPLASLGFRPLRAIELNRQLEADYKDELKKLTKKLKKLQEKLYRKGIPLVAAFEGWDAAGKGGAIRRLCSALDARGFTVTPVSAPTPVELSHHYLWRFFQALPPKGHIGIFDRTWYGRVMVERVEGLCTQPQWQRAYEEINRFEKLWTDAGGILCKFWLQIDEATQLSRFNDRKDDPEKQWKLTDEDWRNRDKWPRYEQAVDEVLQRTHTANAPWTVVEANDKEYARIKVLRTVIDTIEKHLDQDDNDED